VIGFQCDEWLESFLHYCRKELGAQVDDATGRIDLDGRTVLARAYPIGIDYDHFTRDRLPKRARRSSGWPAAPVAARR
jgi:trehalose 6-phosphate synthase